jgi:hypothetical protein
MQIRAMVERDGIQTFLSFVNKHSTWDAGEYWTFTGCYALWGGDHSD